MEQQAVNLRPRGNQASRRVITELRARVEALEKQVAELSKPKRGRPSKEASNGNNPQSDS